jgi:hypothetical protein
LATVKVSFDYPDLAAGWVVGFLFACFQTICEREYIGKRERERERKRERERERERER